MLDNIRHFLLRALYPFLKLIGKIELPHRHVTSKDYYDLMRKIQVGDILLSRSDWGLTNLFIKGKYKHAAIYIGSSEKTFLENKIVEPCVAEAVGEGAIETNLIDFMLNKDGIAVVRLKPVGNDMAHICKEATDEAKKLVKEKRKYDYKFKHGNKAFYCAELVHFVYEKALKTRMPIKTKKVMDVDTIDADDFYNSDHTELVNAYGDIYDESINLF